MKVVYNKDSNFLNLGTQEEGFREEIFVNQFSKHQGVNPYHLLNSISIMVSKGKYYL